MKTWNIPRLACLLLCAAAIAGCGYDLHDDVDLELNFKALPGPSEALHSPYVKGAAFSIFLDDISTSNRIAPGWTFESDRPGVLALSDVRVKEYERNGRNRRYLEARARAVEEGEAAIIVRASGDEVFRTTVEVLRPDRIELLAHGPLILGRPEPEAVVQDIRVLRGGSATFLARYYRGAVCSPATGPSRRWRARARPPRSSGPSSWRTATG